MPNAPPVARHQLAMRSAWPPADHAVVANVGHQQRTVPFHGDTRRKFELVEAVSPPVAARRQLALLSARSPAQYAVIGLIRY